MATPTYDPIASTTLTSSASSVTFSSLDTIAAGYRDLVIILDGSFASSGAFYFRLNSDSGSNYNAVRMSGDGSSTESASFASSSAGILGSNGANTRLTVQVSLMDFAVTDKHTSYLSRFSDSATRVGAIAGRWANTSAVTSIQIGSFFGGNLNSGTVVSLYGIVA